MQYRVGSIGRIVVAKIEHGDDLLLEINNILLQEKISAAVLYMIGAMQEGALVVGPQAAIVPPEPVWRNFSDGRELLGIGTVFADEQGPHIHLHASLGRGDEPLTGCIREESRVYLVVEVVIMEILNSGGVRTLDELTGLNLLGFK